MVKKNNINFKLIIALVVLLIILLIVAVTINKDGSNGNIFSKISEDEVINLQNSLVSNVGGYYGLYLPKEESVSIDDVNNPYLIAFNLKKYLATLDDLVINNSNGTIKFNFPSSYLQLWNWDNCIADNCQNTSNYTKLYQVDKEEFNNYMHKTYNTTNNYDLLIEDEGKTMNIIGLNIFVDSDSSYYNILRTSKSTGVNTLRAKLINYETNKDYLYIYDKFVYCYEEGNFKGCYKDMNPKSKKSTIVNCSKEADGSSPFEENCKIENDNAFNDLSEVLNTYKHTFKKSGDKYYWIKSEVIK